MRSGGGEDDGIAACAIGANHSSNSNAPTRRVVLDMTVSDAGWRVGAGWLAVGCRGLGTDRAIRVFAQGAAHDAHVQRVDAEQFAAEAALDPHQHLERLGGLHRSYDANQRREDPGRRATQLRCNTVFREQAVVAGRIVAAEIKNRNLSVKLNGRAGYQGSAVGQAGAVDGVAGVEIVAAIQYHVGLCDKFKQLCCIGARLEGDTLDLGVDVMQHSPRGGDLGLANRLGAMDDLPLQVAEIHGVVIAYDQLTDAAGSQIQGGGRSQSAHSDYQGSPCKQALLSFDADLFQQYVAAIA